MIEIDETTLSKDERSIIVYCESCLVDQSGLLEGQCMNAEDLAALAKFKSDGILDWGRIPAKLIMAKPAHFTSSPTHWVKFEDAAWVLAHKLRRAIAARRIGPYATQVFEEVAERASERAATDREIASAATGG